MESEEEVRRLAGHVNAISRANAEQAVASGWSEWSGFSDRQFVNYPEYHHASWLTTAEYRTVVDYYRAHIRDMRARDHEDFLARMIERHGEEEGRRQVAPLWEPPDDSHDFLHPEYRMLLSAMEAGTAAGFQVRLLFWFHG